MKNLFIAAVVMLTATTIQLNASNGDDKNPNTNNEKSTIAKSGNNIGVGLEIDLGRHAKEGCPGRGICKIRLTVDFDNSAQGKFANNGNGTITLTIPVDYIKTTQPEKLQYLNGQKQFVVEEDYTLSKEVSSKLGSESTLIIRAGNYPMSLHDGIYTIIIGDML